MDSGFRHRPTPNAGRATGTPQPGTVVPGRDADPAVPHNFPLSRSEARSFDGGRLQGAHGANWPILVDQQAAVYLITLGPGGIREPHWHPSAWEVNYVISGTVRWTFVGPDQTQAAFEAGTGDVVFAPQGHFHYFENASDTEDLRVLVVFNSSAPEPGDDIGIVHSLSAMPRHVLASVFGTGPEAFDAIPKRLGRVVISRRTGPAEEDAAPSGGR
ncbi:cupin domain-containing protein [Marinitenerispora sediminis]|uniref:Cupin domain-containing protein n=2 Tax=Marinitenerispora sediminis TaxID=1931232 RepID=A0A368T505_9ACTN|nr:cupin domain-containing protein [Marinitenerispora sediminis]RCV58322.1 cupin domain-containing protein [Marinitenerispora sediminis]RCV59683.1 cupin domain-containing protein [Marinitenerispora sediminis]